MKKEKIARIENLLRKIYCFENDYLDQLMPKIELFPRKGLDKMLAVLEKGKLDQDEMFQKWTDREPDFVKNLIKFVEKTSKNISTEYEKEESGSAEDILDVLK